MAIGTDDSIDKFGTADTIHSTPATVADGAFSASSDVAQWTNDDDADEADFELRLTAAGLGGAPDAGATIALYARHMNLRGTTDDAQAPQSNFEHVYIGSFPVRNADADQTIVLNNVPLPNMETSQVYEFYIKNNMGVATGTTWELYITPKTDGPHS